VRPCFSNRAFSHGQIESQSDSFFAYQQQDWQRSDWNQTRERRDLGRTRRARLSATRLASVAIHGLAGA
jgi:hypothetical protein